MKDYNSMDLEGLMKEVSRIDPIKNKDKFNMIKNLFKDKFKEEHGIYPI